MISEGASYYEGDWHQKEEMIRYGKYHFFKDKDIRCSNGLRAMIEKISPDDVNEKNTREWLEGDTDEPFSPIPPDYPVCHNISITSFCPYLGVLPAMTSSEISSQFPSALRTY